MDCEHAKEYILAAELTGEAPREFQDHLAGCPACRDYVQKFQRLEDLLQNVSAAVPDAGAAKQEFLDRLHAAGPYPSPAFAEESAAFRATSIIGDSPADARPSPQTAPALPPQAHPAERAGARRRPWFTLPELSAAAAILIVVGVALWYFTPAYHKPLTSQALVDRLVDVNIQLSQADSARRNEIYAQAATPLTEAVHHAALEPGDRVLVQGLVDNAQQLAANDDPLADAERFARLADLLLKKTEVAAAAGDTRTATRVGRNFYLISTKGLQPKLERAKKALAQSAERKRRLEEIIGNNEDLKRRLNDLLLETPDASNKEILRALGISGKKAKKPAPN